MVVANTLDHIGSHPGNHFARIIYERKSSARCVSDSSDIIIENCEEYCHKVLTDSRRRTFCVGVLLHGVSAVPVESILQKFGKNNVKNIRVSRITEPFVIERENTGPTMGIMQHGGQIVRSPYALSYEQPGSCAD